MTLTQKELIVLSAISSDPSQDQHDTGSTWTDAAELVNVTGLEMKTVRGVLGSLVKKGFVYAEDEVNGQKVDIVCVTEDGCEALLAGPDATVVEEATVPAEVIAPEGNTFGDEYDWHVGTAKLSKVAALRSIAWGWAGTRKEFIEAAVAKGINKHTAATQWQQGRKAD